MTRSDPGADDGYPAAFAPSDWYYTLFPLTAEGEPAVPLDRLVDYALGLVQEAVRNDDRAQLGPMLHWAQATTTPCSCGPWSST